MNCTAVKKFIDGQCKALPATVFGGSLVGYIGAHVVNVINFDSHLPRTVPLAAAPAFTSFTVVAYAISTIVYNFKLPIPEEKKEFIKVKDIGIVIPSAAVMFGVYATLKNLTNNQLLLINGAILIGSVINIVIQVRKNILEQPETDTDTDTETA